MKALIRLLTKNHLIFNISIAFIMLSLLTLNTIPYFTIENFDSAGFLWVLSILFYVAVIYGSIPIFIVGNIMIAKRNRKSNKQKESDTQSPDLPKNDLGLGNFTKREYCEYCGYKYSSNEKNCPSCGATKRK